MFKYTVKVVFSVTPPGISVWYRGSSLFPSLLQSHRQCTCCSIKRARDSLPYYSPPRKRLILFLLNHLISNLCETRVNQEVSARMALGDPSSPSFVYGVCCACSKQMKFPMNFPLGDQLTTMVSLFLYPKLTEARLSSLDSSKSTPKSERLDVITVADWGIEKCLGGLGFFSLAIGHYALLF